MVAAGGGRDRAQPHRCRYAGQLRSVATVTTTLWDTSGDEVVAALVAERHSAGAVASGLAASLVVAVAERHVAEAERAATAAAAAHPCRVIIVVRSHPTDQSPRLDAEVQVGGRLGSGEAVVLRMYGRLALHAESVVLPLLAPDAPVLTWWYGPPPDQIATDPVGVFADRRVTDCALAADSIAALRQRALDYAPGDTDLAWTRTTSWRSLLASAFDSIGASARSVAVSAEAGNPSAALLAGWLGSRLGLTASTSTSDGPGVTEVRVRLRGEDGAGGTLVVSRGDGRVATLARSGLPERTMPLSRDDLGDLLAEELHRLNVDEVYAEALAAWSGLDLAGRASDRELIWVDPALAGESAGQ